MTPESIIVLGTGGHATVVVELARACGYAVAGCIGPDAPDFSEDFCGYLGDDRVIGTIDRTTHGLALGVGSVGDVAPRRRLFLEAKELGFTFPVLAHPSAVVAGSVKICEGAQIMAGAVVQPFAAVGLNAILNSGCIVEHHVKVGDFAHIAPGAVVCGGATIGEATHVGASATVLQNVAVGAACLVGAGAVVVSAIESGRCVKGVPAT